MDGPNRLASEHRPRLVAAASGELVPSALGPGTAASCTGLAMLLTSFEQVVVVEAQEKEKAPGQEVGHVFL